jgi:DHA2 family multidrug resistance protein
MWLSIISAVSLISFVFAELSTEHPIVNLRAFRNITFSTGNIIMFLGFFNLFASIVLHPIYLQTLMGYTAFLSGLVLGPGGIATMMAMPIAGNLVNRMNPKYLLASGIVINAYATYLMSQFNLYADFNTVIWPRIVLGIGMGFFFIPLTTMTMSGIKRENMGNAAAIYNLVRNLGGSFGVAFVTTMLSRKAQLHQNHLVENLTPFDTAYQMFSGQSSQFLQYRGLNDFTSEPGGLAMMYRELLRQSSMMAFNDAFFLVCIIMVCVLPLVLLMKRGKPGAMPEMH